MPLRDALARLKLLPGSASREWPDPDVASTSVHYLRACERVGHHREEPTDAAEALRQLRWACEDPRLAAWAWQDPSLNKLRTDEHRGAFAQAVSPAAGFVSSATLEVGAPQAGALRQIDVVLHAPDLAPETLEPVFDVEAANDKTDADRESWSHWQPLRWRPPVENGAVAYRGTLTVDDSAKVLARFRPPGRPWTYVGKDPHVADGRTLNRWVEPKRVEEGANPTQ